MSARSSPPAERFRPILELGGNNAMIVAPSADLEMAVRAIVFSAVGTAGQRCTSLRRLIVHEDGQGHDLVASGWPRPMPACRLAIRGDRHAGWAADRHATRVTAMQKAIAAAKAEGGKVHGGEVRLHNTFGKAAYVAPRNR
jgi:aldehyde dehydrogenase (NAD+)